MWSGATSAHTEVHVLIAAEHVQYASKMSFIHNRTFAMHADDHALAADTT